MVDGILLLSEMKHDLDEQTTILTLFFPSSLSSFLWI